MSFHDHGAAYVVPRPSAVPSVDALPKGVDKLDGHLFDNIEVFRQVDKGSNDAIAVPSRPPLVAQQG